MSKNITTRFKTHVLTSSVTVDFTTGIGSYFLIVLAPEDLSGTGYESLGTESDLLNTFSTLFTRYRMNSVRVRWCGSQTSTAAVSYVKFFNDVTTGLETSTGLYTYADGADMAARLPYQSTLSSLEISREQLARSGLAWMQTAATGDNVGGYGSLLFATSEAAGAIVTLHLELDMEFQNLLDPNIVTLLGRRSSVSSHDIVHAHRALTTVVQRAPPPSPFLSPQRPAEARLVDDYVVPPNSPAGPPNGPPSVVSAPKSAATFTGYGLRR